MNAGEIAETLSLARSNVSNSIQGVAEFEAGAQVTHQLGDRRDYFTTSDDVWALARTIIEERQRQEIEPTLHFLNELMATPGFEQENQQVRNVSVIPSSLWKSTPVDARDAETLYRHAGAGVEAGCEGAEIFGRW